MAGVFENLNDSLEVVVPQQFFMIKSEFKRLICMR